MLELLTYKSGFPIKAFGNDKSVVYKRNIFFIKFVWD